MESINNCSSYNREFGDEAPDSGKSFKWQKFNKVSINKFGAPFIKRNCRFIEFYQD